MAEIDLEQTIEDDVQISLDENNEFNDLEEIQETASFLKISELKLKCRARNLRLKEEDVIVAVDGDPFHGSILELSNIFELGPIYFMFLNLALYLFEQVKILTLSNFFARKLDIMNKLLSAPPFSIEGKKIIISEDFII